MSRGALVIGLGAALGLGLGACTEPGPSYDSAAFFGNSTFETASVRIFDGNAQLDCDWLAEHPAEGLGPEAFGEGTLYKVPPGEILPIQYTPLEDSADETTPSQPTTADGSSCGAALVQVSGLAPLAVFWPDEGA